MINFLKKIAQLKITKIIFWSIFFVVNFSMVYCYFQDGYLFCQKFFPGPPVSPFAVYFFPQFLIFVFNLIIGIYFLIFRKQTKKVWHYTVILISFLVILCFIHLFFPVLYYELF